MPRSRFQRRIARDVSFVRLTIFGLVLATADPAFGRKILDTAVGTPDRGSFAGMVMRDSAWPAHPFEVREPVMRLTSVAGFFYNAPSRPEFDAFAAIVRLDGPGDLPDSFDLSTPDLVATTLMSVPADTFGQLSTDFHTRVEAGWYAVVFGTGAFGATSVGVDAPLGGTMVALPADLAPTNAFTIVTPKALTNPSRFIQQGARVDFEVFAESVPEPTCLALCVYLGIGLLSTLGGRKARGMTPPPSNLCA